MGEAQRGGGFVRAAGGGYSLGVRRLGEIAVFRAYRVAFALAERASLATVRRWLGRLAGLVYRLDARHRRVANDNLARAFPEWSGQRVEDVARASFESWARIGAELTHAPAILAGPTAEHWKPAIEAVDALRSEGRGVLVLTAHIGNFELMARLYGQIGGVAAFHRGLGNDLLDRELIALRQRSGVLTLPRGGASVRQALRLLSTGGVVAIPLDQNQRPGRGVFVTFFGRSANTSTALARLSLAAGAPVLPVFSLWQGEELLPSLGRVVRPAEARGEDRHARVLDLTRRYTAEIEAIVRRAPEQWNWAHDRWKTQPRGDQ